MTADIQTILAALAGGDMIVLVDDEERENEGDLLLASAFATPEKINFMARYARGLICLTLTDSHCRRLQLPMMAASNHSAFGTNFTVSIEAARGITTGISAADRAATVAAAANPSADPADIVSPGHIFPVRAEPGGVLVRAGHTEAGCDLTAMAGLFPAAVICEIMNEDGSMARLPQLRTFAAEHGLRIGTIASLIEHRLKNEQLVHRESDSSVRTTSGEFRLLVYRDSIDNRRHLALCCGAPDSAGLLVRVLITPTILDGLLTAPAGAPPAGWGILPALQRIRAEGSGILLMLSTDDGEAVTDKLRQQLASAQPPPPSGSSLRHYGIGAQILSDLGASSIRLLSSARLRLPNMSAFGLSVEEIIEP